MPYLLVYVSTATQKLSVPELADLLDTSRENNVGHSLTGALLYQDGNFIQVLEGEERDVRRAYDAIQRDRRHRDVTLLWEEHPDRRQFDDWSMAFHNLSGERSELADRFGDFFRTGGIDRASPTAARYLLDSFRQSLR